MHRKGYIAIISSIIIMLIVIAAASVVSNSNILGFLNTQEFEFKTASEKAARGCLNHALLYLASGDYEGDETISVGSSTCTILPIEFQTTTTIIKATSTVRNTHTNLKLKVNSYTLETIYLEEVQGF